MQTKTKREFTVFEKNWEKEKNFSENDALRRVKKNRGFTIIKKQIGKHEKFVKMMF